MNGIVSENVKVLAQEIYDSLKTLNKKYALRPFNRFDMKRSMWWIIPSKEFPAYKYGKYMVEENQDGTYTVGTHIEKGLEMAIDYKEKLMLDNNWVWHDFIKAVDKGEVSSILKTINDRNSESVGIQVKIDIPDINRSRKIILKGQQFIDYETDSVIELESIPNWISEIDGSEWYWVDFYICFSLQKMNQKSNESWTEYDIVEKLLVPFERWIR